MGSELVDGSSPPIVDFFKPKVEEVIQCHTEVFNKLFPYYLSLGMTYDLYWNGDCALPKHYREADKISRKRTNTEIWLQGMYIYEALCNVAPIYHTFAKSGTKPVDYPSRPYALTDEERLENEQIDQKERVLKKKRAFENWVSKLKLPKNEENDNEQ